MPAGSTYTPIATTTLGSAAASYTFSSIPSTYTDLVLIMNYGVDSANRLAAIRFNGDTSTNYSNTQIYGNGSSAGSQRTSSVAQIYITSSDYVPQTLTANTILHINNYSNATTYKTSLNRYNSAGNETAAVVGLWRSTSAINSITILATAGNFLTGSTFTLYGIAAA